MRESLCFPDTESLTTRYKAGWRVMRRGGRLSGPEVYYKAYVKTARTYNEGWGIIMRNGRLECGTRVHRVKWGSLFRTVFIVTTRASMILREVQYAYNSTVITVAWLLLHCVRRGRDGGDVSNAQQSETLSRGIRQLCLSKKPQSALGINVEDVRAFSMAVAQTWPESLFLQIWRRSNCGESTGNDGDREREPYMIASTPDEPRDRRV